MREFVSEIKSTSETQRPLYLERALNYGILSQHNSEVEHGITRAHIGSGFLRGFSDSPVIPARI